MWLTGIFSLLSSVPGLMGKFLDYQVQKANVTLDGFKTATGVDLAAYQAWLNATIQINQMKLAANGWWGAKMIILTAGWPCAIHIAAIMFDSMPFPYLEWGTHWWHITTHVVGSWGVPSPPKPYDDYEAKIVLSFFIIMPAMPVVNAVSAWLGSKR